MPLKKLIIEKVDSLNPIFSDPKNKILQKEIIKLLSDFLNYKRSINQDDIKLNYKHFPNDICVLLDKYLPSRNISCQMEKIKRDNKYYTFKDVYRMCSFFIENQIYDNEETLNKLFNINKNIYCLKIDNLSFYSYEVVLNKLKNLIAIAYTDYHPEIASNIALIEKYLKYDGSVTLSEIQNIEEFLLKTENILIEERINIANKIDLEHFTKTGEILFRLNKTIPAFISKIKDDLPLDNTDFFEVNEFFKHNDLKLISITLSDIDLWNQYCNSEYIKQNKHNILTFNEINSIFIDLNKYMYGKISDQEFFVNLMTNLVFFENREHKERDVIYFTLVYKILSERSESNPTYIFDSFHNEGILYYLSQPLFKYINYLKTNYFSISLFNKYCEYYNFDFNEENQISEDKEQEHRNYINDIVTIIKKIIPLYFDEKLIYNKYSTHFSSIKENKTLSKVVFEYCRYNNIEFLYLSDLFDELGKKDLSTKDKMLFIDILKYLSA